MLAPGNFFITKEIEFDAGHRVPLHYSQCRNPHGHRYKVQATWSGPLQASGSSTGMVVDFGDLKKMLMVIHSNYDHAFIFWKHDEWAEQAFMVLPSRQEPFKWVKLQVVPTAENLAKEFFEILSAKTKETYVDVHLEEVKVYETPTSVATFTRSNI